MASNFDPRKFQLGSSYRFFYQNLNRLPRNRWTLAIVLVVLALLDHWFIWPILIGAAILAFGWFIRAVIRR